MTAAFALALVLALAGLAAPQVPSAALPDKPDPDVTAPDGALQGGDKIDNAVPIDELPYFTTGTTAGFNDDYDEACPYTGSTSPDVVYSWLADFSGRVDIHTCESSYDTKIYVYENIDTPGDPHDCNDDNADCPGPIWRSWIERMWVTEGNTYYIVVDGYGGDFGDYLFNMYEVYGLPPCEVVCPPGAFHEHEGPCHDGYVDVTNPGCNVNPPIFQEPPMDTWICGTSGNYDDNTFRDMDWFDITVTSSFGLSWRICAEFPVRMWLLYADEGCSHAYTLVTQSAGPYDVLWGDYWPPGHYYFAISVDGWIGVPCGSAYTARIRNYDPCPVEGMSWGTIKAMYR